MTAVITGGMLIAAYTFHLVGMVPPSRGLLFVATIIGEYMEAAVVSFLFVFDAWLEARTLEKTRRSLRDLVDMAQETKTKAQRFLDRFAQIYTPAIVVLAVIVLIFSQNIEFALTFLVIACPGALVISTPISMLAGLGNGARHGVLIKGGDALERFSKIDTRVFDKTGTLTVGRPEITGIFPVGTESVDVVLAQAAQLELASEHPLGRTIVEDSRARGLDVSTQPTQVEVIKGGGIRGDVGGRQVAVGSRRVLATMGAGTDVSIQTADVILMGNRDCTCYGRTPSDGCPASKGVHGNGHAGA